MADTVDGYSESAVREIRSLIFDLRDEILTRILKGTTVTTTELKRVRNMLDTVKATDLADQMQEILSKYAKWSYEGGLAKIDGMIEGDDLSKVLNLPPADVSMLKTYKADKIVTIAPKLLDEVSSQVALAFAGQRTPTQIARRISQRFETSAYVAERIVRTENKFLQNAAEETRIQQAFGSARAIGLPMLKFWIHSSGQQSGFLKGKFRAKYTPRPHHKAMHGVEVAEGEKFALVTPDGLTWRIDGPHDEILPVEEAANCYCDRGIRIDREKYRLRPQSDEQGFPLQLDALKDVKNLGGTTGAMLVEDPRTGTKFVMKKGNSPEHIREEVNADSIYQAAGIRVPEFKLYETPDGPVKLAKYIEDATPLSAFLKKNSMRTKAAKNVVAQLQEGFATDTLLGNWDVVGLEMDNVLVDKDGNAWRIDNGGSLRYRAQGAKKTAAQWNGTVSELTSMRSPTQNAQTAKIFAGLSDDDVKKQISSLLERKGEILSKVPDATLWQTLNDRFEYLEKWAAPKGAAGTGGTLDETFAEAVARSRIVGKVLKIDREDIEDTQALFWTEKAGKETVVRMKTRLTSAGASKLIKHLQDSPEFAIDIAQAKPSGPVDPYWEKILSAIKTVNHHVTDGQYSTEKVQDAIALKGELDLLKTLAAEKKPAPALYTKFGGPKNATALANTYLEALDDIEAAMAGKVKTKMWNQHATFKEEQPTAVAQTVVAEPVKVSLAQHTYQASRTEKGFAHRQAKEVYNNAMSYQFELDGVQYRFVPYEVDGTTFQRAPYALRGYLEADIKGKSSVDSYEKIVAGVERLGVKTDPTTDAYKELVYLRKGMQIRTDVFTAGDLSSIDQMIRGESVPDEQVVASMKTLIEQRMKIKLPAKRTETYDWEPKPNAFGEGWERTYRWDLPREKVEKEMAGFTLHHSTSSDIPTLIDKLLNGGGDFTPTTERLRKGVSINAGMSPTADLQNGTANYLFTRIKSKAEGERLPGFNFKVGNLARQDAFSFHGDWMGGTQSFTNPQVYERRGKSVSEFKQMSKSGSNETLLKNGISILDEIESIVVSKAQRQEVIDLFKKHGYDTLPDGRKIDDVVRTSHY